MHMLPFYMAHWCGTGQESITNDNVLIGPTEDVFMHGDVLQTENLEFWMTS